MLQQILTWMQQLSPAMVLGVLLLAAMIEYLFPPFPGDSVTLLGGFYAALHSIGLGWVFAAVMVGSLLGSAIDYFAGRWADRISQRSPRLQKLLSRIPVAEWEEKFRHRAGLWLIINRFLPAVRGPIFFAAGVCRVRASKALFLGGLSALAWNGLLFGVGYLVGFKVEVVETLMGRFMGIMCALVGVILLYLAFKFWRSRRKPPPSP